MGLVKPRSVVDVGCGVGAWLSVFAEHGVDDYIGVDGGYVAPDDLLIPADRFVAHDLSTTLRIDRRFDLAVCLEVGEHLPARAAAQLVETLVRLASTILFSAAVPGQGGIEHVNEQWPDYWQDLFASHSYNALDLIRPAIWDDEHVAWWYAQNTLLFMPDGRDDFGSAAILKTKKPLRLIHPRMHDNHLAVLRARRHTLRELARDVPGALVEAIRFRL